MSGVVLRINNQNYTIEVDEHATLLWVLRERLGLLGVHYGCGIGECGHCTVLLDGEPAYSCQLKVGEVTGRSITTIEGIAPDHPVIRAWLEEQVVQRGYCQPAQVLRAIALIRKCPEPDLKTISEWMDPVLCRCGTYPRIRRAILRAASFARQDRNV